MACVQVSGKNYVKFAPTSSPDTDKQKQPLLLIRLFRSMISLGCFLLKICWFISWSDFVNNNKEDTNKTTILADFRENEKTIV